MSKFWNPTRPCEHSTYLGPGGTAAVSALSVGVPGGAVQAVLRLRGVQQHLWTGGQLVLWPALRCREEIDLIFGLGVSLQWWSRAHLHPLSTVESYRSPYYKLRVTAPFPFLTRSWKFIYRCFQILPFTSSVILSFYGGEGGCNCGGGGVGVTCSVVCVNGNINNDSGHKIIWNIASRYGTISNVGHVDTRS